MTEQTRPMRVIGLRILSDRVRGVTLAPVSREDADGAFAAAGAGAHVDLHLPGRDGQPMIRHYSLIDAPDVEGAIEIAVLRADGGRGGSAYVHDGLALGDIVPVGGPRNLFAVVETAAQSVLIAGGIGIAPIRAIARRLTAAGKPWTLHYACRSRASAAFAAELEAEGAATCFADEGAARLDLVALAAAAPADAHVYCCGPERMIAAFSEAFASFPAEQRHLERFAAGEIVLPEDGTGAAFEIVLARSGRSLRVGPGGTILAVARAAGAGVAYSCREGVCGMCETRVIEGVPQHHCSVLTETERAAGNTMMICCSRATSERLVLDL